MWRCHHFRVQAGIQSATGDELYRLGPFFTGQDSRRTAIAMKYLDWWYSDEGRVISSLGVEDTWWKRAPNGSLGAHGQQADYEGLSTPSAYKATDGRPMLNYLPVWIRGGGLTFVTTQDPLDINGAYFYHRYHYLNNNISEKYRRHVKYRLPELYIRPQNIKEMTDLQEEIDTFVDESVMKFIVGELDIERDWQWFQTELDKKKLNRLVDLWQSNYEASAYHMKYWRP